MSCGSGGVYICDDCVKKAQEFSGEYSSERRVLFRYNRVIRKSIHTLKYRFASDLCEEFAVVVAEKLQKDGFITRNDVLVPVPMTRMRKNWRGFNHMELLVESVAKKMKIDWSNEILTRKGKSSSQVGKSRTERVRDISGVFAVNSELLSKYNSQRLIVFDDVLTTGATMNEAMKVLKRAKAKKVYGLVIAG